MGLLPEPRLEIVARNRREVLLLDRAVRDLLDIQSIERRRIATEIDKLATDALPRGVEPLTGRHRDYLRLRVGRFRVLYRVGDAELIIVAITS